MADSEHLRGDTVRVRGPIPVVVYEAAVQAAGTALHWRKTLFTILRTAGMKQHLVDAYQTSGLSKFQIARDALDKFAAAGQNGWKAQRRFVAELANLPRADENAPDMVAGQKALDELRRVAFEANLLVSPEELERRRKLAAADEASAARSRRLTEFADVRAEFAELAKAADKQRRGYGLEKILASLFRLDELQYDLSYKTETDQVDGAVTVDSFLYLVEARWRDAAAVDADLGGLTHKAGNRLDATRGLFLSMAGFREEVVQRWRMRPGNRLILMDGIDLALIIEERISMTDALKEKIHAAGKRGEPYLRLAEIL